MFTLILLFTSWINILGLIFWLSSDLWLEFGHLFLDYFDALKHLTSFESQLGSLEDLHGVSIPDVV